MKREDKSTVIDNLVEQLEKFNHFYITDVAGLNAEDTSDLRRACFEEGIKLIVVKNTLFMKALGKKGEGYEEIFEAMKGSSAVMFTETANVPAKLIKEFRKKHDKPVFKGAFAEECIYLGEDQLEALALLKSKDELIGDIVALLQSPAKNVISALQSGGNILHGVLETLKEKE
jgi:large subunit ribosomal protein L10